MPKFMVVTLALGALWGCGVSPMLGEPGHALWRHDRSVAGSTLPRFPTDAERSCFVMGRC